jgi:hypothetical protein
MKQKFLSVGGLVLNGLLFAFFVFGFIFINGAFGLNSTPFITYTLVSVPSIILIVWSAMRTLVYIIRTYEAFKPKVNQVLKQDDKVSDDKTTTD